jgi:hypothetical protein
LATPLIVPAFPGSPAARAALGLEAFLGRSGPSQRTVYRKCENLRRSSYDLNVELCCTRASCTAASVVDRVEDSVVTIPYTTELRTKFWIKHFCEHSLCALLFSTDPKQLACACVCHDVSRRFSAVGDNQSSCSHKLSGNKTTHILSLFLPTGDDSSDK